MGLSVWRETSKKLTSLSSEKSSGTKRLWRLVVKSSGCVSLVPVLVAEEVTGIKKWSFKIGSFVIVLISLD